MQALVPPCSWKGCLANKPGRWEPVIYFWAVDDDQEKAKPMPVGLGKSILYCDWCRHNRDSAAIISQYPKIIPTVKRAFELKGKREPGAHRVYYRMKIQELRQPRVPRHG